MILVDLERVTATRPDRDLFRELSLTIRVGDRIGIVGINGTGKSTLLRVLAGRDEPESGTVRVGRGVRVGMLEQQPALPPGTVHEAAGGGWESAAVLERLGMGALVDADVATLSGGQAKRTALARLLVEEHDLLVLDEPTNHLDLDATAWLEDRLAEHRGGLVLVTHDRHLLDRTTTRMVELDRGRAHVHDGGYASYLEARELRSQQAANAEDVRRNLARRELAWLRRGAPARTRKSKSHIARATAVVEARPEAEARPTSGIDLDLGTPRLGDKVIELHDVAFAHPGHPPLFAHVDLALSDRGRLGIVGPNGTGKSTLLDVIAGRRPPTEGRREMGPTVQLGYHDQLGVELDLGQRVRDAVAGPSRQPDWRDAALMERFWFDGDAQWARIGTLSGGERRRLQLLLVLAARPNVLLLDEPTNDLDLDTLRSLEELLDDWPGSLVVISHDRAFLERTVEDVVVLDGEGHAGGWPGGFAAWEAERRLRRGRHLARTAPGRAPERAAGAVQQSSPGATTSDPPAGAAAAGRAPEPASPPRRPPSHLRKLIRQAESEMAKLEARRDALDAAVAAAGTSGDVGALTAASTELGEVAVALAEAEERWLTLSEELEAGRT